MDAILKPECLFLRCTEKSLLYNKSTNQEVLMLQLQQVDKQMQLRALVKEITKINDCHCEGSFYIEKR